MSLRSGSNRSRQWSSRLSPTLWDVAQVEGLPHPGMLLVPDAGKVEVEEGSSPLALMTQRSNASPKRPEPSSPVANTAAHAEYDEQGEDEEAVPEAAAAAPGNLLGGDNEAALASRRRKRDACVADPCAVVLERRSRPKAAAGPVDIPPEVREWLRQPTRKTGKRRRAATWSDAKEKLTRLGLLKSSSPTLAVGTIIHLFRHGSDATIRAYDPVRRAYRVYDHTEQRHYYEVLHGAGHVNWDLIETPMPPGAPSSSSSAQQQQQKLSSPATSGEGRAVGGGGGSRSSGQPTVTCSGQPTRRKLQEHMAAMDAERLDDAAELCAVCTDSLDETDVTNPVGVMPCCGKRVHKTCATKWRASNNNLKVYVNVPLKYEAPDTRCCMFCRSPEATKYCSTRRMFGAEIEGAAGLPPPPPVPRCRRT